MTRPAGQNLDALASAWRELQSRASVKLHAVENERHYSAMVDFINTLLDKIGDREDHPLIGLLDVVTCFVEGYEKKHVKIPDP